MILDRKVRSSPDSPAGRRLRVAMGTWVAIEATHESPSALLPAIDAAFAAVLEVERLMHPWRPGSDVARINAGRIRVPIELHPSTWELLALAQRISEGSDGVFDPCLPNQPGCMSDVELTAVRQIVCHAPVAIDLGGIAKGYAVDRAVAVLRAHGCHAGLVNAGGDVRVCGSQSQRITLRLGTPAGVGSIDLWDESLAAAEANAKERPPEHQGYYDRRTGGRPRFTSAAVIAPEAAIADALVKCALLCDAEPGERVLRAFGARLISRSQAPI